VAVALLVVAMLTLVAASVGVALQVRQGRVDRERRRDEVAPQFEPVVVDVADGVVLRLRLVDGQRPLTGVRVEIVRTVGVYFDGSRPAAPDGPLHLDGLNTAMWDGVVFPGWEMVFPLRLDEDARGAALQVTDRGDPQRAAAVAITIPPRTSRIEI
jgi:hypothetical protein